MSINIYNLDFSYKQVLAKQSNVLKDINLEIADGDFVAIIGKTGCGKSTLIQNMNGLLLPTKGKVVVGDFTVENKKMKNIKELRKRIGMAFQFPEHQLFEDSVLDDVMFGPINFGISEEVAKEKAIKALNRVGVSEELFERAPFQLSGGQMRRVAIAGILAYDPEILILDEPTAGLDPKGQKEMLELFVKLNSEGLTTIIISHDFNHVVECSQKTLLLNDGKIEFYGNTLELFNDDHLISKFDLVLPHVIEFRRILNSNGYKLDCSKYDDLVKGIVKHYE